MKNKTNAAKLYTRLFSNTNFPCLYLTVAHTYIHRHIQTSPTPHRPTRVARAFNTFHISRLIANTQQFSLWFVRLPRIFPTLFMHIAHIYPFFLPNTSTVLESSTLNRISVSRGIKNREIFEKLENREFSQQ